MENRLENIDNFFRDKLEGFQEEPRPEIWDNIALELGKKKKNRVLFFMIRIAAGMTLLISLGTGYYFIHKSENKTYQENLSAQQKARPSEKTIMHNPLPSASVNMNRTINVKKPNQKSLPPAITAKNAEPIGDASKVNVNDLILAENNVTPGIVEIPDRLKGISINLLTLQNPLDFTNRESPEKNMTDKKEAYTQAAFAQLTDENTDKMNKEKKWQLGGDFAPLFSYRSISSDYYGSHIINELNDAEKGVYTFAGGLNLNYSPSKRFSLQSGISYSRYGQEKSDVVAYSYKSNGEISSVPDGYIINNVAFTNSTGRITPYNKTAGRIYYTSYLNVSFDQSSGISLSSYPGYDNYTASTENVNPATASQYFDYLELPLLLKYKLIDKKLNFNLIGGLVTNFMIGNKILLNQNGKTIQYGKTENINKINCSGSLGFGIEYPIFSNLMFSVAPQFRYYLNPIDKSQQINVHPYSFGIYTGISYAF